MTRLHGILTAVLVLVAATPARAVNLRMEASTTWAENIGRSTAGADMRNAQRYEARASLSLFREWVPGFSLRGEFSAGLETVRGYALLGQFTAGPNVQFRRKFGLGAFAPSVELNSGFTSRSARYDGNDGWTATAGLRVAKRLTSAWRFAAVADWQQDYARESIFDTRHHRVFGTVTWDIDDRWQLSYGNGRLWGDFTANASAAVWPKALAGALGTHISEYYQTVSWRPTGIMGPNWVTYRVTGHVDFWWLELTPALGRNTSLPLRYENRFSLNKVGIKYRQELWSIGLLQRF
jgi:hypothetical protein